MNGNPMFLQVVETIFILWHLFAPFRFIVYVHTAHLPSITMAEIMKCLISILFSYTKKNTDKTAMNEVNEAKEMEGPWVQRRTSHLLFSFFIYLFKMLCRYIMFALYFCFNFPYTLTSFRSVSIYITSHLAR